MSANRRCVMGCVLELKTILEKLSAAEADVETTKTQLASIQDAKDEAGATHAAAVQQLESDIAQLKSEVNSAQAAVVDKDGALTKATDDLAAAVAARKELDSTLNKTLSELQGEKSALESALQESKVAHDDHVAKIKALEVKLADTTSAKAQLENRVSELEASDAEKEAKLKELGSQITTLQDAVDTKTEEARTLEKDLMDAQKESESYKQAIESQLQNEKSSQSTLATELTQVKLDLDKEKTEHDRARADVTDLTKALGATKDDIHAMALEKAKLEGMAVLFPNGSSLQDQPWCCQHFYWPWHCQHFYWP